MAEQALLPKSSVEVNMYHLGHHQRGFKAQFLWESVWIRTFIPTANGKIRNVSEQVLVGHAWNLNLQKSKALFQAPAICRERWPSCQSSFIIYTCCKRFWGLWYRRVWGKLTSPLFTSSLVRLKKNEIQWN